jgi:pimeloyl-ACP methyl ester carboxylesterase
MYHNASVDSPTRAAGSWTHWVRNIDALAARHGVLAIDLPGYGASGLPSDTGDVVALADTSAAAIMAILDDAAELDLVGFSFGGIVATLMARTLRGRVGRLVLIGAGGIGMEARVPEPPEAQPPLDGGETKRLDLARFMFADVATADDLAVRINDRNIELARFRSGSAPASTLLLDALPDVDAVVHALYGDSDAFSGGNTTEPFARLRQVRPDVRCVTVAAAGHWSPYEAADRINAQLLKILAEP